jgi:hypothetical protein
MRNSDLIAFLEPIPNQFSQADFLEVIDVTGRVADVRANSYRLSIRLDLPAGLYRGRFETVPNAFDMSTAMIEMVRVPDGKRVPVGPWDLDHIHNVMAVPMIRTFVNGQLKGALWFAMPGPEQIAEGRLAAEFGFQAREGENELVLELIERDRARMSWSKLAYFELRNDDRREVPLSPTTHSHPRIFLSAGDAEKVRERWTGTAEFASLEKKLLAEELVFLTDNSQGTLELASLFFALTGDERIGSRAKAKIMELAHAPTWSGRPDPLLMGGDNDRGISLRLYQTTLAWDYLQALFSDEERRAILSKVNEYLQKIFDFTLLQRAYMGCPAIDPHSLGSWNGPAIACMAFYDDLEIARRALPLFHGLFCDSLKLFPASGKAAWATYFPFHLVLYLAAAHTFGGNRPELSASPFLDNLGQALLASFEVPNSQELQRGLRTREHRFLTAFLNRFHPTPGIDSIYRAFVERERQAAGDVALGIFDLLYAPSASGEVAAFPTRPLFAGDIGEILAVSRREHVIAVSLNGGPKAGRQAQFKLMPHNREFPPALGAIEMSEDGTPVLCNINMGVYGIDSALTNTMCFEDGGALTNGQYLNGAVAPEACAAVKRCFMNERFIYAHVVVTHALDPKLNIRSADRLFVFDQQTGIVLLSDAFTADREIRFATHLHCSGAVTELGENEFRLTGGQANLIAGIKGGSKGLDDAEKGEIFVQILKAASAHVVVEEPKWIPGYIYGLNNTGQEDISQGRFPRYTRWRLEMQDAVSHGSFLVGLSPKREQIKLSGDSILLPENGHVRFGFGLLEALGAQCECECLLWDEESQRIMAIGSQALRHGNAQLSFDARVDIDYSPATTQGTVYAQGTLSPVQQIGIELEPWESVGEDRWRTNNSWRARFRTGQDGTKHTEKKA